MAVVRTLDYCAVRSLVGREAADEMFRRVIPGNIDMDFPPDQDMASAIVREREAQDCACSACSDRHHCHD